MAKRGSMPSVEELRGVHRRVEVTHTTSPSIRLSVLFTILPPKPKSIESKPKKREGKKESPSDSSQPVPSM